MFAPLHCLCVDSASCEVERIGEFLIVGNAFIMAHIEAAVVAEDTGSDFLFFALHQFGYPLLIGKERSCKTGAVKFTFGY